MIISKECIEAIEYIAKIYSCFKSPDDVIRGMLRDFARNTDNDVIFDILKKNTSKRLAMIDADRFTKLNDSIKNFSDELTLSNNEMNKALVMMNLELEKFNLTLDELSDSIDDLNNKLTKR